MALLLTVIDLPKGPIITQEDIPTGVTAAGGSRVSPPSYRPSAPAPGQTGRRSLQEIITPTHREPLPTRVNTTQVEGRPFLTEGSQVDRIIRDLRDTASGAPRDLSQRLQPAGTYTWIWVLSSLQH